MRILMVSQFYPPVVGGQERVVADMSAALVQRGHDVAVMMLDVSKGLGAGGDGVRVHTVRGALQRVPWVYGDRERRHVPPVPDPLIAREFERILDVEQPDVVHAHDWLVHSLVGVTRRRQVPIVLSLHDYGLICANKRLYREGQVCDGPQITKCARCSRATYGVKGPMVVFGLAAVGQRTAARVDRFLPVSEAVALATGLRDGPSPVTVLPNFVSDGLLRPEPVNELPEGVPDGDFVCFVGDATADKGVPVLLEAHRRLRNRTPLVLVGRPLLAELRRSPPNVRVLGRQPHPVVLEILRRSTLVAVPSVCAETFSLAALEGMVAGRPVVASRIGGVPEVVAHGETGVLVPPGLPASLADAIDALLDDEGRREAMGRLGRQRAERVFSESSVISQLERVYELVVAETAKAAR